MKIQYLGHSCFKLTESTGTSVVCDPYDSSIGYAMVPVSADAVTVSHGHFDHNAIGNVSGSPIVLDQECNYELPGVDINSIKSFHDECRGKKRGENIIFKFRMDGVDICHLGDIGENCSAELLELILPCNVLLIPVGGNYTIDAERAKEYVDRLMPDIVIPMHYKQKHGKIDIDKVHEFVNLFDEEQVVYAETDEIEVFRDDVQGDSTKIVVLERTEE